MKQTFFFVVVATILLASCGAGGGRQKESAALDSINQKHLPLPDDKSIYGLACDGCNDTVVYLLFPDGSDPVKFNTLQATKRGHVYGSVAIGNNICVVPNAKDSTTADYVIDLDDLKGTWCYSVLPELRVSEEATEADRQKLLSEMSDSLKELYFVAREYGFTLKRQYAATPVGMEMESTIGDDSPVMYPPAPLYYAWHILNGKLVLTRSESLLPLDGEKETRAFNDTCEIMLLSKDSLALRFAEGVRGFYRKGIDRE